MQKNCRKHSTTSFDVNGNRKFKVFLIQLISFALDPKRWRTTVSSPHSTGGGPGGGETALAVMAKFFPTKPSGVQLAIATIPPGRQTRINSAATFSGRGANMAPNIVTTASK